MLRRKVGALVTAFDGTTVCGVEGVLVVYCVGICDGPIVGDSGDTVGNILLAVGAFVGVKLGDTIELSDGVRDGRGEGFAVGDTVGAELGMYVGRIAGAADE